MSALTPGARTDPDGAFAAIHEPPAAPSGRVALVVRLLLAVGLVVGMAQSLMEPVERPLHELYDGLRRGAVETVTIMRPESGSQGYGTYPVEWTGDGLPGRATYEFSNTDRRPEVDEGQRILEAAEQSPTTVDVTIRDDFLDTGISWHGAALAGFVALLLLIGGPQPRLATKWAWFWLAWQAPLLWLAFVVLEPVPLWRRRPLSASRRLTGGWAFLLSITAVPFVGSVLMSTIQWIL
ncbi:hypothetical protein GCM10023169_16870 [Georgenia halophila]|uniref:DUF3592 domain-containing protein n=1 Tax=Georgenia halophila TaxID=620889 RepID=A0ABP8L6D7_9MICO